MYTAIIAIYLSSEVKMLGPWSVSFLFLLCPLLYWRFHYPWTHDFCHMHAFIMLHSLFIKWSSHALRIALFACRRGWKLAALWLSTGAEEERAQSWTNRAWKDRASCDFSGQIKVWFSEVFGLCDWSKGGHLHRLWKILTILDFTILAHAYHPCPSPLCDPWPQGTQRLWLLTN